MKFKIKQLSIVLIVVLYSCLINYHLTAELRNSNSNLITNSNTSSAQTKTSIFEGFKAFSQNTSKINITKGKATRSMASADPGIMGVASGSKNPFASLMGEKAAGQVMDSEMKRLGKEFNAGGEIDLGNGPVYHEGWVKFFRFLYEPKKPVKLKAFFKNPEFKEQMKGTTGTDSLLSKTGGENDKVMNPNQFWCMVFKDNVNFLTSKENKFQTVYDSLKISYINKVSENAGFHGGIKDIGSFKEGECFQVTTMNAGNWNWIICVKAQADKDKLMTLLKKIILKNQRANGFVVTEDENDKDKKIKKEKKQKPQL